MKEQQEDDVPLFRKWTYWYVLVVVVLILLILFFYMLTKHFS